MTTVWMVVKMVGEEALYHATHWQERTSERGATDDGCCLHKFVLDEAQARAGLEEARKEFPGNQYALLRCEVVE